MKLLKTLTLILAIAVLMPMASAANQPFSDLTDYMEAITWMNGNGVIVGYPDGEFKPDKCVNRAEFLKMMFETKSQAVNGDIPNSFNDVDAKAWYYPYVATAAQLGIVNGYSDGSFKPDQCVSRAEAIKMAIEGMEMEIVQLEFPYDGFTDVKLYAWYTDYIYTAFERNIVGMLHVEADLFGTGEGMSRSEVAEMLYRLHTIHSNVATRYYDWMEPLAVEEARGTIEGTLSHPSDGIPEDLRACATNLVSGHTYCTNDRLRDLDRYIYGIGYKLDVPVGSYYVYADIGQGAYYTEFMECGASIECESHELIEVVVEEGENYFDAYIGDYYIESEPEPEPTPSIDDDAMMGHPGAPITIIEFSDYECPFCQSFYRDTFPQIKENYIDTGIVKFVYRDYPLANHSNALNSAMAAECARDQGDDATYFEYHDLLFDGYNFTEDVLLGYAEDLELDADEFSECLSSEKFREEVERDIIEGDTLGVYGTPTFFINKEKINGAQPYEFFEEVIDRWYDSIGQ